MGEPMSLNLEGAQPVFQYYVDVGANAALSHAAVFGFRTKVNFWKGGSAMKPRAEELKNIAGQQFDLCVIGGGATGSACALDAQLRGIRTVLLDAGDFAGATSSAATKIIHGGVRYLEEAI